MYGNNSSGLGKNRSRFGKKSEDDMTSIALNEAIGWTKELMDREHQGRGDKEYLIRHRLSRNSGVPESYLYRLQYKARDMKDVAGEYYRRLRLYYDSACERHEEAADRYRSERLGINNETTDQKPTPAGVGMAAPKAGKASTKKA